MRKAHDQSPDDKPIATTIGEAFTHTTSSYYGRSTISSYSHVESEKLYDYLYERDHKPYVCNLLKATNSRTQLEERIKKLHTTESLHTTGEWTEKAKVAYCQGVLEKLASDILSSDIAGKAESEVLRKSLELDGYVFTEGKLRRSEGETKDVEQERGEMLSLYVNLGLPNEALVRDCLNKSEEHFESGAYRDCVSNARHFLEKVVHDVAEAWSKRPNQPPLVIPPKTPAAGPSRNYLRDQGLISADECTTFASLHGLLSATGGHPALPDEEQARVFRRLALSMALFVLLVYKAKR
ncbi:MAG TPA: hypothetical protein VI072_33790 [Polyangiaceae bacterium]